MFKNFLESLIIFSSLLISGCSSVGSVNANEYDTLVSEIRDNRSVNDYDSFFYSVYNRVFGISSYDYSFCKKYNPSRYIEKSCISPLKKEDYKNKRGILMSKSPDRTISLDVYGKKFNFNIHKVVFEDGEVFESLSFIDKLPYEKKQMKLFPFVYFDVLDTLKQNGLIKDYEIDQDAIIVIDNSGKKDSIQNYILRINFLAEFIPNNKWAEIFPKLNDLEIVMLDKNDSGFLFPELHVHDSEVDYFMIQASNTNFSLSNPKHENFFLFFSYFESSFLFEENDVSSIEFLDSKYIIPIKENSTLFFMDNRFNIKVDQSDFQTFSDSLKEDFKIKITYKNNDFEIREIHIEKDNLRILKDIIFVSMNIKKNI